MIDKIEPKLLSKVNILNNNDKLECIVYTNSIRKSKVFLEKIVTAENIIEYPFIKAIGIQTKYKHLLNIASQNFIRYISSNSKVCAMVNVGRKIMGVENIDIPLSKENNFSCAVIDTGVFPHIDLLLGRNKIIKFVDLVNNKKTIYDDNGHGTFVTTVLAGGGIQSGSKYKGVDSNINIISIKALDENGETGAINILKAMQWVYDNKEKYNIRIVSMSFGSAVLENNDPLILGAEALWDIGVVVVCACGNSGPDRSSIKSPSASSKVISVGALDDGRINNSFKTKDFKVADFSSRGPILNIYKPDIVISGVNITSACNFAIHKKFYTIMSGTSVATPMVAGAVSLLLKKHPYYTPNQIKKVLINHCRKITGDRNSEGYGWLNLSDRI